VSWRYEQDTGRLFHDGEPAGSGYSGYPPCVNDPSQEALADFGPIPRGGWTIGVAFDHPRLGPVTLPLEPAPGNDAHGRREFFIHGDSISDPGMASHGCIIMPHDVRVAIARSGDCSLTVALSTPDLFDEPSTGEGTERG
jgi:Protein of unknown function (DUF2778)